MPGPRLQRPATSLRPRTPDGVDAQSGRRDRRTPPRRMARGALRAARAMPASGPPHDGMSVADPAVPEHFQDIVVARA